MLHNPISSGIGHRIVNIISCTATKAFGRHVVVGHVHVVTMSCLSGYSTVEMDFYRICCNFNVITFRFLGHVHMMVIIMLSLLCVCVRAVGE